jgi:hypothetical protein
VDGLTFYIRLCSEIHAEYAAGATGWFPADGSSPVPELLSDKRSVPYQTCPPMFSVNEDVEALLDPTVGQQRPPPK